MRDEAPHSSIYGYEAIGQAVRADPRQIRRWASRQRDPLPLFVFNGMVWIYRQRLEAWKRREHGDKSLPLLFGWSEIAKAARLSVRAAQRARMTPQDPLPVEVARTGRVWAYPDAVLDWHQRRILPWTTQRSLLKHSRKGYQPIAQALHVDPKQIRRWASRQRDPLPLYVVHGVVRIHPRSLDAWKRRHLPDKIPEQSPTELDARRNAEQRWPVAEGVVKRTVRGPKPLPVLYGWNEIANEARLCIRTAQLARRASQDPLPVEVDANGCVWAFADAVLDWYQRRNLPWIVQQALSKRSRVDKR